MRGGHLDDGDRLEGAGIDRQILDRERLQLARVLHALEHRVDRGDVDGSLGEDRAVLVGATGLVELRNDVELAVGAGRFTEVDRGVDEHRIDLLGLECGVGVGERLVRLRVVDADALQQVDRGRRRLHAPLGGLGLGEGADALAGPHEHALLRLEVRLGERDDLRPLAA